MPIDEQQVDSIAVNLLTPLIARLIGWASGVLLGGAGISLTVPGDAAGKIAIVVVGLVGIVAHQLMAKAVTVSNAKSAYVQGAASAGATILLSEVPPVVSGKAPTPVSAPPSDTPTLKPTVDSGGNVTFTPPTK